MYTGIGKSTNPGIQKRDSRWSIRIVWEGWLQGFDKPRAKFKA